MAVRAPRFPGGPGSRAPCPSPTASRSPGPFVMDAKAIGQKAAGPRHLERHPPPQRCQRHGLIPAHGDPRAGPGHRPHSVQHCICGDGQAKVSSHDHDVLPVDADLRGRALHLGKQRGPGHLGHDHQNIEATLAATFEYLTEDERIEALERRRHDLEHKTALVWLVERYQLNCAPPPASQVSSD